MAIMTTTSGTHPIRERLIKSVGVLGGAYVVGRYVLDRIEDARCKMVEERQARDNLKRRFHQTTADTSYTVLALLPTLADQVLAEMDVELLTAQLQSLSKLKKSSESAGRLQHKPSRETPFHPEPQAQPASTSTSSPPRSEMSDADAVSDAGSTAYSVSSVSTGLEGSAHEVGSTSSWVERFSDNMRSEHSPSRAFVLPEGGAGDLSDSMISMVTTATSSASGEDREPHDGVIKYNNAGSSGELSPASGTTTAQSKSQLWKEVKITTFTRTITAVYTITLLSLLTTVQLSLLARARYLAALHAQARSEVQSESSKSPFPFPLFSKYIACSGWSSTGDIDEAINSYEAAASGMDIDDDTEGRYLTLSWWLIHVGWCQVGEKVRQAVESVLESVSLKAKLSHQDVMRLIEDVRRRIDDSSTSSADSQSKSKSTYRSSDLFLDALLPPTPESLQHTLTCGGTLPPAIDSLIDFPTILTSQSVRSPPAAVSTNEVFDTLLSETRIVLGSSSFSVALSCALDSALAVFATAESGLHAAPVPAISSLDEKSGDQDEGEQSRVRLAGLLPGLARWSREAMLALPNTVVDMVLESRESKALTAIVFADFESVADR